MEKGKFITFEGPDGSGKTTVSQAVIERLQKEGYRLLLTREPGGIAIAEQIRSIILDPKNIAMDARTEALLYAASRRQHLVEKVLPALEEGVHVISDRFIDSSLAYQGCGRQIGIEAVFEMNQFAIENHMPVKTIYFDIDAETGLERIKKGRSVLDRLDQETLDFHHAVFEGYQKVIHLYPERMIMIDARKPLEEVIEAAYLAVKGVIDGE